MAAPVILSLTTYLSQQLNIEDWDGEVPRWDTNGNPINPLPPGVTPPNWPVVVAKMPQKLHRIWTFENAYDDEGPMLVQIYGTTRAQVEALGAQVETLLANSSNWSQNQPMSVLLNPNGGGRYFWVELELDNWLCEMEEGIRTQNSGYLYRFDWDLTVKVHGSVATR